MSTEETAKQLSEAITSGSSDKQILRLLQGARDKLGKSLPEVLEQVHRELPLNSRDRFAQIVALLATGFPELSALFGKVQERIKPEDAEIVLVAPNPAIDIYLRNGTIYPGGAAGTIGSILTSCRIPTIICGFLSHTVPGEIFKALAQRRGIETSYLTDIQGDCGFTIFLSPTKKISRIGPSITKEEKEHFLGHLEGIVERVNPQKPPLILFSGSVPPSDNEESEKLYADLIEMVRTSKTAKKSKIWIDTKERFLYRALDARPDYVKINQEEFWGLLELLAHESKLLKIQELEEKEEDWIIAAKRLIDQKNIGAMTVMMGGAGAFQVWKDTQRAVLVKRIRPVGKRIYAAGLGDTLLAIQAIGEVTNSDRLKSLEYAVAAALVSGDKPGTQLLTSLSEIEPYTQYLVRRTFNIPGALIPSFDIRYIVGRMKRAGMEPVIVVDMDDTLTLSRREVSDEMASIVGQLLARGIKFVILTSSSIEAVQDQVLKKLTAQIPDKNCLVHCCIFVAQGSQAYQYNPQTDQFELIFLLNLQDPQILGEDQVKRIKKIIFQTVQKFKLAPPKGEFIEDRRSQITFLVLGSEATPEEKSDYDKRGGREKRIKMASYIQGFFDKKGIGVCARPAGKSSIDIAPLGIDKGFGMEKIAETLGVGLFQTIFFADELWEDGTDVPAAQKAAVTVNVGPASSKIPDANVVLVSEKMGPEGALEQLRAILASI